MSDVKELTQIVTIFGTFFFVLLAVLIVAVTQVRDELRKSREQMKDVARPTTNGSSAITEGTLPAKPNVTGKDVTR
jgi:hypothetical protein